MRKTIALLALIGLVDPAAAINKCPQADGKVVYSDMPCPGGKAQQITIQKSHVPTPDKPRPSTGIEPAEYERQLRKRLDLEKIDRDIAFNHAEINRLENNREAEINNLMRQGARANNNLAGATFLNSLAQEQNAVAIRYNASIQQVSNNLQALREQRKRVEDRP